jgi:ATP-dependent protease Clp ATPase subunit
MSDVTCAFCNRLLPMSPRVVAGPKIFVCDNCVVNAWAYMLRPHGNNAGAQDDAPQYCSFCGKERQAIACLASHGASRICNECVELCSGILLERLGFKRGIELPLWTSDGATPIPGD